MMDADRGFSGFALNTLVAAGVAVLVDVAVVVAGPIETSFCLAAVISYAFVCARLQGDRRRESGLPQNSL